MRPWRLIPHQHRAGRVHRRKSDPNIALFRCRRCGRLEATVAQPVFNSAGDLAGIRYDKPNGWSWA